MVDVCDEYERYLEQYKAFLRANSRSQKARLQRLAPSKRQRVLVQLLVWYGRLLNWLLGAIVQALDEMVWALTR